MFSHANFTIQVLDNNMVHLVPEVRNDFWKKSCVLVIIGGRFTEFTQVNDTHFHKQLKVKYREIVKAKMLGMLVQTLNEILTSEMTQMLYQVHAY